MIRTVLYDMDGLLLDTEPLWGQCMLRVAERHGIPITRERFKETTGLRIYEVTEFWSIRYPWAGAGHEPVAEEILDEIIEASKVDATVLEGVEDSLKMLRKEGFKIGLASSSPARMIHALVEHFGFKIERQKQITSDTGYVSNPRSMLQSNYRPVLWIARKN
ncbi:MAG: HAD family hydrolase [Sphingobacteriales bacterium]|nr:MAG: HAD family hydrolase [Sphingobacteriales bacterium]